MERRKIAALLILGLACGGCSQQDEEPPAGADPENRARKLESLPYVAQPVVREENRGLRGVVRHDEERAHPGTNLYGSLTRRRVLLRAMDGELVHTWDGEGVFSDRQEFPLRSAIIDRVGGPNCPGFTVAELHGGHLYAIESLSGLVRMDRASNVLLALNNHAHHDLDIAPDGSIYVLTAAPRELDVGRRKIPVADDFVEILAPDGTLRARHSIMEILSEDPSTRPLVEKGIRFAVYWFAHLDEWIEDKIGGKEETRADYEALFALYRDVFERKTRTMRVTHQLYLLFLTPADIFHTNTLQVLPARADGLWQAGHVLVSVRNLDLVAVLDLPARKVVWAWGPGELSRQHQPSLLANGNLLIFDNGTAHGRSRVIEVDPATREIVWSYGETPETSFFCGAMGGCQELPNGNILVTESGAGRAFEITRDGEIVWDFFNPDAGFNPFNQRIGEETIEAIYRLTRIEDDAVGLPD